MSDLEMKNGAVLYQYEALREDGSVVYRGVVSDPDELDFYLKGHPSVHALRTWRFVLEDCGEDHQLADRSEAALATWAKRNNRR